MATYALFCNRTEAVAALDSITIRPPDEDREGVPVFGWREFRYPHVLGGNAGNLPDNSMAGAEKWADSVPVPGYAIDDQTAIKVTDGTVEVVSERHWKLFTL